MCESSDGVEGNGTVVAESGDWGVSVRNRKLVIGTFYAGFVAYATLLAPGDFFDAGAIGQIVAGKWGEVNDLYVAIFNMLGVIALNYIGLLNPGAGQQKKLPTALFTSLGLFLGFFAVGPYIAGREYVPSVTAEEVKERGFLSRVCESKGFAAFCLLSSLAWYAFALGVFSPDSIELRNVIFYSLCQDLGRMFTSDRGVHISMLDISVLSVLSWGPLTEDMRRRGWCFSGKGLTESAVTALSILAAPGLGVSLYLLLRPNLPESQKETALGSVPAVQSDLSKTE